MATVIINDEQKIEATSVSNINGLVVLTPDMSYEEICELCDQEIEFIQILRSETLDGIYEDIKEAVPFDENSEIKGFVITQFTDQEKVNMELEMAIDSILTDVIPSILEM